MIYEVCPLCWALSTDLEAHLTWHESQGETLPEPPAEPTAENEEPADAHE